MVDAVVRFTASRLDAWRRRWPGSTLTTGYAVFDGQTGDVVDLGGRLVRADVDGHEFDAFVDDWQGQQLRAVRGMRAGG